MCKVQERERVHGKRCEQNQSCSGIAKASCSALPLIEMLVLASGWMPNRPVFSFADHWEKTQVGELTYSIGSA